MTAHLGKIRHRRDDDDCDRSIRWVARKMGLPVPELRVRLPELHARGFPRPDPTTGNWDGAAVMCWRAARHPELFGGADPESPEVVRKIVEERLERL
jgi:hypothetical protein